MKLQNDIIIISKDVAPLVGAWIEISVVFQSQLCACVAPLVGAWIEISQNNYVVEAVKVAPLVGAWIEIRAEWL